MAITARTWVEGEVASAAKFNTIRDDILELNAVAGFFNVQYGTITIPQDSSTADATVSTMSPRAVVHCLGHRQNYTAGDIGAYMTKVNSTTVRATRSGVNNTTVVSFAIEDPRG